MKHSKLDASAEGRKSDAPGMRVVLDLLLPVLPPPEPVVKHIDFARGLHDHFRHPGVPSRSLRPVDLRPIDSPAAGGVCAQ
jgi:hypothetical protein